MVITRLVDSTASKGERRWMKQNHHDECCHRYRKKLLVTLVFIHPYSVSVRPLTIWHLLYAKSILGADVVLDCQYSRIREDDRERLKKK
jgi:hypothetical protein